MNDLYEHQKKFLLRNPKRCLLCWTMGTGKTRASIEYIKQNEGEVLIICPKSLKANWARELKKWGADRANIMSKEEFRRDWDILNKYDILILDEGHYFAGRKSAMSKHLSRFIIKHKPPRILFLSATPYRSSPWDIYMIATHLGYYINYIKFEERFFETRYVGRVIETRTQNGKIIKKRRSVPVLKDNIENDVARIVAQFGDIVNMEECTDIPEQVYETEVFDLTKEQEHLKKINFESNPIVRYTKYHEIENGVLVGNEYEPDRLDIPNLKNERIIDLCKDNNKIVVVCRYNLQIDSLKRILSNEIKDKEIFIIRGNVKDRDSVVQEAEKKDKAIVLIQATCSEGYELPSFPVMVFASMDFSFVHYKQMTGRIHRMNKLKKNVYLHLVSKGIDTCVYNAIMRKQSFDIAIYSQQNETNNEAETLFGEGFSNRL